MANEVVNQEGINKVVDVESAKAEWKAYQQLCKELLNDSDYQEYRQKTKDGFIFKKFPKKSAWAKLGRAFNVNTEIIGKEFVLTKTGETREAYYCIRATLPNGRTVESDGSCSRHEKGKGEATSHTIRSTAKTRATNRAISELIGAGEVSAEELDPNFHNGEKVKSNDVDLIEAEAHVAESGFTTADKLEEDDSKPVINNYVKSIAKQVIIGGHKPIRHLMTLKAKGCVKRGEIAEEYLEDILAFIDANCPEKIDEEEG
ncbi:hypothetical protein [Methanobrevibacter olleyae]|uniref:Phage-related protein n=1 Tax=Methanobrevibacter olleyae TaxID=294671 RepID=A0A126R2L0_METOL|nr:hypothetical protein [Methanobrevibacter olleyae]AMK16288.1 phage-related protein [Methanobrevibacter olleyae]